MRKIEIIGKGKYACSSNQQFVDRSGQLVRVNRDDPTRPIPIGEAYAFHNCPASDTELEKELPFIRKLSNTPSELELTILSADNKLIEGIDLLREVAHRNGMKTLRAHYPCKSNYDTALELSGIMIQLYQSPLYENEPFEGCIVYKRDNIYVILDE